MNRKLIWKFNIIDLIIIAIVILSLFALCYRLISGGDGDERIYTVTYMCEEAPKELLYGIRGESLCADGEDASELGKVTGMSVNDIPDTEYASATLWTEVEAYKGEHGIIINDKVYLKGMPLNLIVGDSVFEVYIKNIE